MKKLISTRSAFEKSAGYSRAVVKNNWCFVSGTTGYDYKTMTIPEDVEEQAKNCLTTIKETLQEAGFNMSDVVRANYYITSKSYADSVFPILGEAFKDIQPAATMVVCELIKPEMKIEIQVTAMKE